MLILSSPMLPCMHMRTPMHAHVQPVPHLASAAVAVMGGLLTLTSFLLLMALDYMPDIPSRCVPVAFEWADRLLVAVLC